MVSSRRSPGRPPARAAGAQQVARGRRRSRPARNRLEPEGIDARRRQGPRPVPVRLQRHQGPRRRPQGRRAGGAARRRRRSAPSPTYTRRQQQQRAVHRRPGRLAGLRRHRRRARRSPIIDTGIDYTHANFGGAGTEAAYDANDSDRRSRPARSRPPRSSAAGTSSATTTTPTATTAPRPPPRPRPARLQRPRLARRRHGRRLRRQRRRHRPTPGRTTRRPTRPRSRSAPASRPRPSSSRSRSSAAKARPTSSPTPSSGSADYNATHADAIDVVNMSLGARSARDDDPDAVGRRNNARRRRRRRRRLGRQLRPQRRTSPARRPRRRVHLVAAIDAIATFPGAIVDRASGDRHPNGINQNASRACRSAARSRSIADDAAPTRASAARRPTTATLARELDRRHPARRLRLRRQGRGRRGGRRDRHHRHQPRRHRRPGRAADVHRLQPRDLRHPDDRRRPRRQGRRSSPSDGQSPRRSRPAGTIANPTYKQLADFSSGGPRNGDSAAKPDVTAPGVHPVDPRRQSAARARPCPAPRWRRPTSRASPPSSTRPIRRGRRSRSRRAIVGTASAAAAERQPVQRPDRRLGRRPAAQGGRHRRLRDDAGRHGQPLVRLRRPRRARTARRGSSPSHNTSGSAITYNLAGASIVTVSPSSITVPAHGTAEVTATAAAVGRRRRRPGHARRCSSVAHRGAASTRFRGAVVATPTTAGTGVYSLRIPFLGVPRGLSNISAGPRSAYTTANGISTRDHPGLQHGHPHRLRRRVRLGPLGSEGPRRRPRP